jgi:DNA-binding LytR/AlgR family response regulator
MKVVLIDDEAMALENLKYIIGQFADVDVLDTFTDPLEAIQKLNHLKPDAVFLDIEMPQINGFTVAEEIYEVLPDVSIIFVTGFNEYAVRAFEISAIDYVIKPVSKRRLKQTIDKLFNSRREYKEGEQPGGPYRTTATLFRKQVNKIITWKEGKIMLLNPGQILYFCADEGDIAAVSEYGNFKVRDTLNYWEERLSEFNFFRCHRSFLINLEKVELILPMFNNTYDVKLVNHPINIPVSRKYARQLKQTLGL